MTMIRRLLRSLHSAVFNKSPMAEPAFRIRHPEGLVWRVVDDSLMLTFPYDHPANLMLTSGEIFLLSCGIPLAVTPYRSFIGEEAEAGTGYLTLRYDLTAVTFGQLVSDLQSDGFTITNVAATFAGLQASVLAEGQGDQDQSNGDLVKGFTSLLWSLLSAYARELRAAKAQITEALKQMVIPTSSDEWLDLWGRLFNAPRLVDEADADYAPRIPEEAFRRRVNALAIEKAILDATGKDVRIEEPWGTMFRLDESALSGTSRFYDGGTVGYHLLLPVSYTPIVWDDVIAVIDRNRAAGVMILQPETRIRTLIDASVDGSVWSGHTSIYNNQFSAWSDNRLSYMVLSGEEITRNFACATEERFFQYDLSDYPDSILSTSREMTGFTWAEMGAWTDLTWNADEFELDALFAATDGFYAYVNTTLPEDLP